MHGNDLHHNLPQALKLAGYATGHIGKWHLASDEALAAEGCTDYGTAQYACSYSQQQNVVKAAGFDTVDALFIDNMNTCGTTCSSSFSHNMEWQTAKALTFMDASVAAGTPFFLHFNPTPPHGSDAKDSLQGTFDCAATPAGTLDTATETWAYSCSDYDGDGRYIYRAADFSAWCSGCSMPSRNQIWAASSAFASSDRDRSILSGLYWIDQSLGVLYTYLSEKGILDDTIVVVLTDNGESKGTAYENGIRTLLNLRWRNGDVYSGTQVGEVVSNVDVVPTLLSMLRLAEQYPTWPLQYDTDGVDISSLALGTATALAGRTQVVAEMVRDVAVVGPTLKYVYQDGNNGVASSTVQGLYPAWGTADQLYDVTTDSAEQANLAGDAAHSATVATLQAAWSSHVAYVTNNGCCSVDLQVGDMSRIDCGALSVANSEYVTDCASTTYGSTCGVGCAEGYSNGNVDVEYTCTAAGTWAPTSGGSALSCEVDCGTPTYSLTNPGANTDACTATTALSTCAVTCNEGYSGDGATYKCSSNGNWWWSSGAAPTCAAIDCGAPSASIGGGEGGNVDTSACDGAGTSYGATCAASCITGYDDDADFATADAATYVCGSDGAWAAADGGAGLTCAFWNYGESFTTYQYYKVAGNAQRITFTDYTGTERTKSEYESSYCGAACTDAQFLSAAAEICATSDGCEGMTFFNFDKVYFKSTSSDMTAVSAASTYHMAYDGTTYSATLTADDSSTTTATRRQRQRRLLSTTTTAATTTSTSTCTSAAAQVTIGSTSLDRASWGDKIASDITDSLGGDGFATVLNTCFSNDVNYTCPFDAGFDANATAVEVAVEFQIGLVPGTASATGGSTSKNSLVNFLGAQSNKGSAIACSPLSGEGTFGKARFNTLEAQQQSGGGSTRRRRAQRRSLLQPSGGGPGGQPSSGGGPGGQPSGGGPGGQPSSGGGPGGGPQHTVKGKNGQAPPAGTRLGPGRVVGSGGTVLPPMRGPRLSGFGVNVSAAPNACGSSFKPSFSTSCAPNCAQAAATATVATRSSSGGGSSGGSGPAYSVGRGLPQALQQPGYISGSLNPAAAAAAAAAAGPVAPGCAGAAGDDVSWRTLGPIFVVLSAVLFLLLLYVIYGMKSNTSTVAKRAAAAYPKMVTVPTTEPGPGKSPAGVEVQLVGVGETSGDVRV
eukprot:g2661.t1